MVDFKDVEKKVSQGKRNIKITGVSIIDGQLCDEDGSIIDRLADVIPNGVDSFDLKISIILEDDDMDIEPPNEEDFEDDKITDGYEGLTF